MKVTRSEGTLDCNLQVQYRLYSKWTQQHIRIIYSYLCFCTRSNFTPLNPLTCFKFCPYFWFVSTRYFSACASCLFVLAPAKTVSSDNFVVRYPIDARRETEQLERQDEEW
jgi:hypothetical protein